MPCVENIYDHKTKGMGLCKPPKRKQRFITYCSCHGPCSSAGSWRPHGADIGAVLVILDLNARKKTKRPASPLFLLHRQCNRRCTFPLCRWASPSLLQLMQLMQLMQICRFIHCAQKITTENLTSRKFLQFKSLKQIWLPSFQSQFVHPNSNFCLNY